MTLWLGLPPRSGDPGRPGRRSSVDLRDLRFNPDRHLSEPFSEEVRNLIRAKQEAIAAPVGSRRERQARCLAIRRCNEALQPWVRDLHEPIFSRCGRGLRQRCGPTGRRGIASSRSCFIRRSDCEQSHGGAARGGLAEQARRIADPGEPSFRPVGTVVEARLGRFRLRSIETPIGRDSRKNRDGCRLFAA